MRDFLLHLSDLHLGAGLRDTGQPTRGSLKGWTKTRRLEMQSHDGFIVSNLHIAIRAAARAVGVATFDFCAITGDISTNATNKERFTFAKEYLTKRITVSATFQVGLGIDPGKLLCVPGNHDKMLQISPEHYLSAFGTLPAPPPYIVKLDGQSGRQFVFLGLDSNLYVEGNVAEGYISPDNLGWLAEQLELLDQDENSRRSVRILLLHHHPADLNQHRRFSIQAFIVDRFTRLAEGERLLQLCDGRVDVILHGHEHFPFVFREKKYSPVIVSAGSTSEWSYRRRQENSFFVACFHEATIVIKKFTWNGASFPFEHEWTFQLKRLERLAP